MDFVIKKLSKKSEKTKADKGGSQKRSKSRVNEASSEPEKKKRDYSISSNGTNAKPAADKRIQRTNLKKNLSHNDIGDVDRSRLSKMQEQLRTKDEKLAAMQQQLEEAMAENQRLQDDNDKLGQGVKHLQDEIAAQECLVRLERGDYEELKAKEAKNENLAEENSRLNEKIETLEKSAMESVSDRIKLETIEQELQQHFENYNALQQQVNDSNELNKQQTQELLARNEALTTENKIIETELKNSLHLCSDLEKQLQKIQATDDQCQSEKDNAILDMKKSVRDLEVKLRDSEILTADQREIIQQKDAEIQSLQSTVQNFEESEERKDEIVKEKERVLQYLKYKLKDTQETYESQFEEMMTMNERQLKAVRAEQSDTTTVKKLQSEIKVLENKLQSKTDEQINFTREITELKRKLTRAENDTNATVSLVKFEVTVSELSARIEEVEGKLKQEKYLRIEERDHLERKIKNLQGHMINIYTGNIPPEMAQMLDTIVKIKLNSAELNTAVNKPSLQHTV